MTNCIHMPKMTVIPFQTKPQQPKNHNFRFCCWTLAITHLSEPTSPEQWRHVPGKLNPGANATRGLSADEFAKDTTWLYGASFLYEDQSKWPEQHYDVPEDAVKEKKSILKATQPCYLSRGYAVKNSQSC